MASHLASDEPVSFSTNLEGPSSLWGPVKGLHLYIPQAVNCSLLLIRLWGYHSAWYRLDPK